MEKDEFIEEDDFLNYLKEELDYWYKLKNGMWVYERNF